ncbi:arsenate reductase (glutaredoxin) [Motilimonas sp. 1_MG-2023]|uniref:arsenate reductase (glutaredoxin) n=1 Tax=Motilimonas sp. 1_MG-2023 TaxID=3062672 RepID=UPI0026E120FB|nr:arsenate reductase (glutaredoxin) [Motilimonas sp. 1_MG-2023]MDO6525166.1 arsenate reductase (glutaredoxin) [Motilimonas sp. 1_MG-2023]
MSQVQIYHNPRCSKSRETLALLEAQGLQPEIVLYLSTPLSTTLLSEIVKKLGFDTARQLIRTKETLYKELALKDEVDEKVLLNAMVENPKLIERPIVIYGDKAALGRPPEQVLDLF